MPKPAKAKLIISHDSRARLEAAGEWLNVFPPDTEILVLSPTREAGDEFVRNAVAAAGTSGASTARFGLLRLTLDRLAVNLAAPILAGNNRVPTTSLSLEALTARAVHLLVSEEKLSYFAPVAKRPGFPRAVARTLDELRMNAVDIEAIRRLPRGGPDLAALAECVERELALAKLADRSAVFEAAIEGATNASLRHPAGLPLLLLDVAVTSTLEAAFIKALVSRAPSVFATAARGDIRTIGMLHRGLGCKAEEVFSVAPASSLATLKTHLFEDSK